MKAIKYICFVLGLFTMFASLKQESNDAKADFQKIGDAYKGSGYISIDISYALYPTYETATAQEEKTGNAIVSKNLYYNHFAAIEILKDNRIAVVADNARKILILKKVEKTRKNSTVPIDLDSVFKGYKSIQYQKNNEEQGQYLLVLKNGNIEKVNIAFNLKTFLIEDLVIYYKDVLPESGQSKTPPRVEIKYTNHILSAKQGAGISVGKFFSTENGKYVPKGIYKKYEFINSLSR
jgi:hypothetical protein